MDILEKLDWMMEHLKQINSSKSRDWVEKMYEFYLEKQFLTDKQMEILDNIYKQNFI